MEYRSYSEEETTKISAGFATTLQAGDIVALNGDLGAGKSVFCREIIRTLCGDHEMIVPSPTFSLLQTYETLSGTEIYHFDLYRLEDVAEIYELGWEDALSGPIVLIEWSEKLRTLLPERVKKINIEENQEQARIIKITE